MMNLLQRHANGKNISILSGLLLVAYLFLNAFHNPFSVLSVMKLSGGHTVLNLLPYYDAKIAYEHLLSYPPEAISIYHRIFAFDIIIMIPIYLTLFSMSIFYFLNKLTKLNAKTIQLLAFAPVIAAILNIIEDAVIALLLNALPEQLTGLATISGLLTTFKSTIITVCLFFTVIMFFVGLFKKSDQKN